MKPFFKHILTEPDNCTFCPIRFVALIGIFQYLGTSLAAYIQYGHFDPQGFAIGLGALIAGTGASLGLKKDTEQRKP